MEDLRRQALRFGIKKTRRKMPSNRRKIIFKRDGKKCRYCGVQLEYETFHVDHILPVSHFGDDYVFNLCASCPDCNLKKGANKDIVPKPLSFVNKLYEIYLILKYKDYPSLDDYI